MSKNAKNLFSWQYTVDPNADTPIITVDGEIGVDVDGKQLKAELYALDAMGIEKINIVLNSPGGSVIEGMSIYSAIANINAEVSIYCDYALSISAIIFLSGNKRYIKNWGKLMYHNPYNIYSDEESKMLLEMKDSLVKMISDKNGVDMSLVDNMMNSETWISAEQAVEIGFADEVCYDANSVFIKEKLAEEESIISQTKIASLFMNKFVEQLTGTQNKQMKEIKTDEIMDFETVEVIDAVEVEICETEETMEDPNEVEDPMTEDTTEEVSETVDEVTELRNKLAECMNELAALKEAKNKAELELKENKINDMLNGFVEQGKIKKESVEGWKNLAKTDFDTVYNSIKDLPVNKVSNTFGKVTVTSKINEPVYDPKDVIGNKLRAAKEKNMKRWEGKEVKK